MPHERCRRAEPRIKNSAPVRLGAADVNSVREIVMAGDRLRDASGLPELLLASFDAFECIRIAARSADQRVPELFATFMMTADAAIDGREAVLLAPRIQGRRSRHSCSLGRDR